MSEMVGDSIVITCPRCGVEYNRRPRTLEKYAERGMSDWDAKICVDCKPTWVRKERVSNDEIWAAYARDNGLVA